MVPGRGFGAQRMANPAVLQAAQRLTALTLVPGTLNVRLPQPVDSLLPWYFTEAALGGNVSRDHAPNRTGIRCDEVLSAAAPDGGRVAVCETGFSGEATRPLRGCGDLFPAANRGEGPPPKGFEGEVFS
jgi:hypothetical protein